MKDGDVYDGEWCNGIKQGTGLYKFSINHPMLVKYKGQFMYDMMHGIGSLKMKK